MGVPPPVPKCDAIAPFEPDGVNDVSDKPGSPPPTSAPNVPQEPQGNIAAVPSEVASSPSPQQGQSSMTDYQVLERNQDHDGPLHAGQPPAASGGDQPTSAAAVTDDGNFHRRVFTPQEAMSPQQAMSELGMSPSAPSDEPRDYGTQFVGVTGWQASPSPLPNGSQSPTPSSRSYDSETVYRDGIALAETSISGQIARETAAESARNARNVPGVRSLSPATRERMIMETFGCDRFQGIPGFATCSVHPHYPDIDISDEERPNNP